MALYVEINNDWPGLIGYPWIRVGGLLVKNGFTILYRNFSGIFFSAYGFFQKEFLYFLAPPKFFPYFCESQKKLELFWSLANTKKKLFSQSGKKTVQKNFWTVFLNKTVNSLFRIPEKSLEKIGHVEKNKKNPGPVRHPILSIPLPLVPALAVPYWIILTPPFRPANRGSWKRGYETPKTP